MENLNIFVYNRIKCLFFTPVHAYVFTRLKYGYMLCTLLPQTLKLPFFDILILISVIESPGLTSDKT